MAGRDDGGVRRLPGFGRALVVLAAVVLVAGGCTTRGASEAVPSGAGVGATLPATVRAPTTQAELDEALRDAAWADDVEAARRLVARGADVDAKDGTEQSAYLVATSEGHLELLELTLEAGADVDAKDSWNGTGLIRAAERGHHLVVGRLLRAGIDEDHVNRIGYQAVHEAVWFGADAASELATLQVLVAGGVELDRPSVSEGLTPLQMARERGYRTLERVLDAADRHQPSADPEAALLAAARPGTRMRWRWRCATGHASRRVTPRGAPLCSSRPRVTTSRPPACSSRWARTRTPWTTSTTPRGSSPGSRGASGCSRRCCRPGRISLP